MKHRFIDHRRRLVISTNSADCPDGCTPLVGAVPSGYAMQTPLAMMDAAGGPGRTEAELRAAGRAVIDAKFPKAASAAFDAVGRSPLMDAEDLVADVLAACPAGTRDLRDKAARLMLDAEQARGGALDNAIANLGATARDYATRAFRTTDAAAKAAMIRAADTISGYCAAKQVLRHAG